MLNYEQIAKRYGVSEATIRRWWKGGSFPKPSIHTGKTVLWNESNLDAWDKTGQAELMQIDERETQETIAEAKAEPAWTPELSDLLKKDQQLKQQRATEIRAELGLSPDASEHDVLIAIQAIKKTLIDKCGCCAWPIDAKEKSGQQQ